MRRAALLIGVHRTGGGLPRLEAVGPGVAAVARWARAQGFTDVLEITDMPDGDEDAAEVTLLGVQKALRELMRNPPEQLLVYFAGHGVNIGHTEHWLLSGAPDFTTEAVSVDATKTHAAYSGARHVVIVSDACRTAASGIAMQSLTGGSIFRNADLITSKGWVDVFLACGLGDPAYEARSANPDTPYAGVYTSVMVDALYGQFEQALDYETDPDAAGPVGLIRPWPLQDVLDVEVGRRLARLVEDLNLSQTPEATITSRGDKVWVSRLPGHRPRTDRRPTPPRGEPTDFEPPDSGSQIRGGPVGGPVGVSGRNFAAQLRAALDRQLTDPGEELPRLLVPDAATGATRSERRAWRGARQVAEPPGYYELLSARPFVVKNDRIRRRPPDPRRSRLDQSPWWGGTPEPVIEPSRTTTGRGRRGRGAGGGEVAVRSSVVDLGDTLVVLPEIDGYLGVISSDPGNMIDVGYEPRQDSARFDDYLGRVDSLRVLRALLVAGLRSGTLRLRHDTAEQLATEVLVGAGVDPSLALYAAYAFHDLQRDDLLHLLLDRMANDLGAVLFDIALLAGVLGAERRIAPITPKIPILRRGWVLFEPMGVSAPPEVTALIRYLQPATYTQLSPAALERVQRLLNQPMEGFR